MSEDGPFFEDGFEDGDYTADPAWEIALSEGDFSAAVVHRSSPDGGTRALRISETTGGGTSGVIEWADPMRGWDGPWRFQGLFYAADVSTGLPFQHHSVDLYRRDGDAGLNVPLGFTRGDGSVLPFTIRGDLIEDIVVSHDPGWRADTWYRYEVEHNGDGAYLGWLWEAEGSRPLVPNAASVGQAPGAAAAVAGLKINGARFAAFNMDHAFVRWGPVETDRVEGSATTLAFVPGENEFEHPLNSTFPDVERTDPLGPAKPGFDIGDRAFHGDDVGRRPNGRAELPEDRDEALAARKEVAGLDGEFRKFRFGNRIEVSFEAEDGELDADTVEFTINGEPSQPYEDIFVFENREGHSGGFEAPVELFDPDSSAASMTILEPGYPEEWPGYVSELFDSRTKRAYTKARFLMPEARTFTTPDGESVEGIRTTTIWAASNPYTSDMLNKIAFGVGSVFNEFDALGWIQNNPTIYSWIELSVLADGTTLVRVPDLTVYPKHDGYVNGRRAADSGFRVVWEGESDDDSHTAAINEDDNNVWSAFKSHAEDGPSPYLGGVGLYLLAYRNKDLLDQPAMAYGESDGELLGREETLAYLPEFPLPGGDGLFSSV